MLIPTMFVCPTCQQTHGSEVKAALCCAANMLLPESTLPLQMYACPSCGKLFFWGSAALACAEHDEKDKGGRRG